MLNQNEYQDNNENVSDGKQEAENVSGKTANNNNKRKGEYQNQETIMGTPIEEISEDNLLVLDNYAFSINELEATPEEQMLINPYTNQKFTQEAITKLKQIPSLLKKLTDLVNRIKNQPLPSMDVLRKLHEILRIANMGGSVVQSTLESYLTNKIKALLESLTADESNSLKHYVIGIKGLDKPFTLADLFNQIMADKYVCYMVIQNSLSAFFIELPETLTEQLASEANSNEPIVIPPASSADVPATSTLQSPASSLTSTVNLSASTSNNLRIFSLFAINSSASQNDNPQTQQARIQLPNSTTEARINITPATAQPLMPQDLHSVFSHHQPVSRIKVQVVDPKTGKLVLRDGILLAKKIPAPDSDASYKDTFFKEPPKRDDDDSDNNFYSSSLTPVK